jgi:hypothetical protein
MQVGQRDGAGRRRTGLRLDGVRLESAASLEEGLRITYEWAERQLKKYGDVP